MIIASTIALLVATPQVDTARTTPKPVRTPTTFTAIGTYSDGTTRVFDVTAGDLDGDGVTDAMQLHVTCSGSSVSSAMVTPGNTMGVDDWSTGTARTKAPRDVATGQSSGKRQHRPLTMSVSDPMSMKGVPLATTYDLKTLKGARMMSSAPTKVSLSDISPAVCGPH